MPKTKTRGHLSKLSMSRLMIHVVCTIKSCYKRFSSCNLDFLRTTDTKPFCFQNGKAFREISGPILAAKLGDALYMNGDTFTALDVIIGYALLAIRYKQNGCRWKDSLINTPVLKALALICKIMNV